MIRTLGIVLSFVAAGIAQQPSPSLQPQAPFAGVFVADATDDGTVWVRGTRYKLGVGAGTCKAGIDIDTLLMFGQPSLSVTVPTTPSLLTAIVAFQGLSAFQAGGCHASWLGTDFALTDTLLVRVL